MRTRWSTAERHRRGAARLALYGALLLLGLALWASSPLLVLWREARLSQAWATADWEARQEVAWLRDYVRIDTSWDTGNEITGARFLADRLAEAGIPSTLEVMGPRQANLWAVLEGRRPEALVLHNHIDTDPLAPSPAWRHPPLSGAIEPPWIFGRGVFDMKSVSIAQLVSLIRLKQSGVVPERSIVFLATGSEEVGSELGTRWILAAHPELASRFWAVLTEGGVVEAVSREEIKYWGIETAQRHLVEVLVCGDPDRRRDLEADVRTFGGTLDEPHLVPEVAAMLPRYARTRSLGSLRGLLEDPQRLLAARADLEALPAPLRSHLRNELGVLPPRPGEETRLGLVLLPGESLATLRARMLPRWLLHGLAYTTRGAPLAPHGSSPDHPLFQTVARTVRERYPGATVGPFFLVYSATDARFFRPFGIPAYGFSPFLIFVTDTLQVGGTNERMALPAFVEGVDLYAEAVRRAVI